MKFNPLDTTIQSISILGSGWLGYSLALQLLKKGFTVHASTRSKNNFKKLTQHNIKPYIIDIDNLEVSHTEKGFFNSSILIINIPSKNINGFKNLINTIEFGQVMHIIFISSTSVYRSINRHIKEDDQTALNDENPLLAIEKLFIENERFKTTVIRFGGLIGNGRNPARFFQSGKTIASPHSRVNVIHHDDCIALITKIIKYQIWGEIFNACADLHPTKAAFYSEATRLEGLPSPSINDTVGNNNYKIIDSSKIKKYLDYQFIYADPMKMLAHTKKGVK